jgi:curli biogenesis system outer membrane secretion channel CsgG
VRIVLNHRHIRMSLIVAMVASLGLPSLAIAAEPQPRIQIAQAQPGQKKRIAVLDFDSGSISGTPFAAGYLGIGAAKGVGDLVINKLVDNGTYRVIERGKIDQILREQDLGASGRIDASTAAKIGKLLGVEAVLVGSITQFNVDVNSSGFSFGGLFGNSKVTNTATVQLTARLIDTETGEIIATAQGMGKAEQKSGSTSVLGVSGSGSTANTDTLLTNAANDAVNQMITSVVSAAPKLTAYAGTAPNIEALIADITDGQVTINKGLAAGFVKGMKVSVERVTKQVKDPATGRVLRTVSTSVGKIELVEVNKEFAVGRILSGSGFKEGDTVKAIQN